MMLKNPLLWKIVLLIGLTIVMLVPVDMVMTMIEDRQNYQESVVYQVAKSTSGKQTLAGPVIVLPYVKYVREKVDNRCLNQPYQYYRYFLPEQLNIRATVNVQTRKIAIYQAHVFQSDINFKGQFNKLDFVDLDKENIQIGTPFIVFALSDSKGIMRVPDIKLDNQLLTFEPGVNGSGFKQGVHATHLPQSIFSHNSDFEFNILVQGTEQLAFVPIARTTDLTLTGNWPHPNFIGDFLPINREVTAEGFSGQWSSSWFANNINDNFSRWEKNNHLINTDNLPIFSTNFVDTVDEYQLNERAVKYAILFISLTFIAFFLHEVMANLQVHPIQYLLVGAALVSFYLLLLALSERLGFTFAYLIASVACCGLITFYLTAVLKTIKRAMMFGGGLIMLYMVLFIVMQSEGNALLFGTGIIFMILTAIMLLTRNLDWYQIARFKAADQQSQPADQPVRLWK